MNSPRRPPTGAQTLCELIRRRAKEHPDAPAILDVGGRSVSNEELGVQLTRAADALNHCGLRHGQPVAVVLPNGPDMATAFLSVAAFTASAPLDPRLPYKELVFALGDLGARALIVLPNDTSAAASAAASLGLPVLELTRSQGEVHWDLRGPRAPAPSRDEDPGPTSVALYLHTSGTTARPKLVPLTHANLMSSAQHIARSLELGERDRCLNVIPLFHIHGLVGALLSSLVGGGSIICTPGFDSETFDEWIRRGNPTWYTAVPSIHQAVLRIATRSESRLRFVRSSSAPLPPKVLAGLEERFDVPVVEAFGMTEASHQISSNPLPPRPRKPGTVGLPTGTEVRIFDALGCPVAAGVEGEVVLRGPNVTSGYASPSTANREAFVEGWFRTGDLGIVAADGYLRLSGRIKEIINRGGKKIAPREVDEVLLDHSEVEQAATFGIAHETLGEDIAAAVVPVRSSPVTEHELRAHCRDRLALHKIPARILLVDRIPKGPTGKLRRGALAESFRRELQLSKEPLSSPLEQTLASLFCEVLRIEAVGREDSFFQLGGDSLSAMELLCAIEAQFSRTLLPDVLVMYPTVASLAAVVSARPDHDLTAPLTRVRDGTGPPVLVLPGDDGTNVLGLRHLWTALETDRPVYCVRYPGLDGCDDPITSVEELAEWVIRQITKLHSHGPYVLIGECFGGFVAFEMACRLEKPGPKVEGLFLLNARAIKNFPQRRLMTRLSLHWRHLAGRSLAGKWAYLWASFRERRESFPGSRPFIADGDVGESELMRRRRRVYLATRKGLAAFSPRPYSGFLVVFNPRPLDRTRQFCHFDPAHGWGTLAGGGAAAYLLPRTKEDGVPAEDVLREVGTRISAHLPGSVALK